MENSKLIHLFKCFDRWEIGHLEKFLASPFFNKRPDVLLLFNYLKKENKKKRPRYNKESAFQYVFPSKAFNETTFHLLSSYLFKSIEEFLAIRSIRKDDALMDLHLAKVYRELNLKNNFNRTYLGIKNKAEKQTLRDSQHHRILYDVELELYNYEFSRSRAKENNLEQIGNYFDVYFITEKLKQYTLQKAHQTVYNKPYNLSLEKEILEFLSQQKAFLDHPSIAIYYHCYQALSTGENHYFENLLELINSNADRFNSSEIRNIYLLAINFCIRQLNAGEQKYVSKMFDLYKAGIGGGYLLENGFITTFTFTNTATLGIGLKQYDWVENFISENKKLLPENKKENVVNYTLASLKYERKDYKGAMQLLATFDSDDYLMNLSAKSTLLKIYYETEELDILESLLESLRVYLNRKEILGYHKVFYKNVISTTTKLISLKPYDKKSKTALKSQIEDIKNANMRNWFLEQLEGI